MATAQGEGSDAQSKAVLAAVLAVKRGFLTPDGAIGMLEELLREQGEQAVTPTEEVPSLKATEVELKIKSSASSTLIEIPADKSHRVDPVKSIMRRNPAAPAIDMTMELNALVQDPDWQKSAFDKVGISKEQRETLLSIAQGTAKDMQTARKTLAELSRKHVNEIRSRLPVSVGDRYTINREVARGGMGRILMATDNAIGRDVAMKEMIGHGVREGTDPGDIDPESVERFLREAKITGQLEHPNIVPVYEISRRADGSVFYVMRMVQGRSLSARLTDINESAATDQQKLAERLKLLDAFVDICQAIAFAHSRGVIHRDLKPDNVMLGDFGETVVLDWGLARIEGEDTPRKKSQKRTGKVSPTLLKHAQESHTLDGAVMGTPAYMPPEQARGNIDQVDERSDVYSLGAILYEMLAGRPPFEGGGPETVLAMVIASEPKPLSKVSPLAPPDLVTLANKALARNPDDRIQSAEELAREVKAFRDGRTLSVYNYSSFELVRRFVNRNKGAVGASSLAAAALAIVVIFSVISIRDERDQATENLSRAVRAEEDRLRQEETVRAEREGLKKGREADIAALRSELAAMQPAELQREAQARLDVLLAMSHEARRLVGVNQLEVSALSSRLLEVAERRAEVLRLALEPVAGLRMELLPQAELQREHEAMLSGRLLAARLAAANGDFALAELIVAGTRAEEATLMPVVDEIANSRRALELYHRERIGLIIAEVSQGRERGEVPMESERLAEFFAEISSYRELQTIQLLEQALQPLTQKAVATADDWTAGERDLAKLIHRVLGLIRMGDQAAPVLAGFMDVIQDYDLFVSCGQALCFTRSVRAHEPLMRAWGRSTSNFSAWSRIAPYFRLVPDPPGAEPTSAAGFADRARIRVAKGRIREAVEDLNNALSRDRDYARAHFLLGWAYSEEGRWREAADSFNRAARIEPRMPGLDVELARVLWKEGNLAEARTVIGRAVDAEPENAQAQSILGAILIELGDHAGAIEACSRAIELDRFSMTAYNSRGIAHEGSGDLVRALVDYTRVVELDPGTANSYGNRANVRLRSGDPKGAIEDYTRALELEPGRSEAYSNRAIARMAASDNGPAMRDAEKALDLDSRNGDAYGVRGKLRMLAQAYADAADDFTHWQRLKPEAAEAPYQLGVALLRLNEIEKAEDAFSESIRRDATFVDAYARRAEARMRRDNTAGAQRDLTDAINLKPETATLVSLWRERARVYMETNEYPAAAADLSDVINSGLAAAGDYALRAEARLKSNDWEGAEIDYTEAIDRDGGKSHFYVNRGIARYRLELFEPALEDLETGIRMAPNRHAGYVFRALIRYEFKEYEAAIRDFTAAMERGYDTAEVRFWRGRTSLRAGLARDAISDVTVALNRQPGMHLWHAERGAACFADRQWAAAERDYSAFLAVTPQHPEILARRAMARRYQQKYDDAIADLRASFAAQPAGIPARWSLLVTSYLYSGRADQALAEAEKALAAQSDAGNLLLRALVHRVRKDWTACLADARKALEVAVEPADRYWAHFTVAQALMELDRKEEAAPELENALRHASEAGDEGRFATACALALRSKLRADPADMDAAFGHLRASVVSGRIFPARLRIDPVADVLRSDARFAEFTKGE